ncbi:hypothetical protein ACFVYJ_11195 [Pontibacter sp. JAM-7]|uniref:hypothetical protein n=1 Tax=Pontibacter sp. JAM-7 TaxID=3366581 RepID=UPI003AF4310D
MSVYLIRNYRSAQPVYSILTAAEAKTERDANALVIPSAHTLLLTYVDCDDGSGLYHTLRQIRNQMLSDLDQVHSAAEVYGLIYWLLREMGIDHRGESLEDTVERLADLEIEKSGPNGQDLLHCLQAAVERIDELTLED